MKYNYSYPNTEYQRKLRELLKFFAGYLVTRNNDLYLEGERIDFPNKVMLGGGEIMSHHPDKTIVVYRINKEKGTVDEI